MLLFFVGKFSYKEMKFFSLTYSNSLLQNGISLAPKENRHLGLLTASSWSEKEVRTSSWLVEGLHEMETKLHSLRDVNGDLLAAPHSFVAVSLSLDS